VDDIHTDIKALLLLFKQRNGVKPESIVVYRDGVSQGEFKEVRSSASMMGAGVLEEPLLFRVQEHHAG
jgi:hypothetical protein